MKNPQSDLFDKVINFYNSNYKAFAEFEHETGLDFWFLFNFRIYFRFKNQELNILRKSNKNLSAYKFIFSLIKHLKRLVIEIFVFVFKTKSKIPKHKRKLFIGTPHNFEIYRSVFKKISQEISFLYNRDLFNTANQYSRNENLENKYLSSDKIFRKYIFRREKVFFLFKALKKLINLKKAIQINKENSLEEKRIFEIARKYWIHYLVYYLRFLTFKEFFSEHNIDEIFLFDENSPSQKTIYIAAKLNNVRVFAFQHGNIHLLHPAYIFGSYRSKPLLPDLTFVWGDYFKNLLVSAGGYNPDTVRVSGRIHLKEKFKTKSKSKNRKIIVYATQPQRDTSLRQKQLVDVLEVCELLTNEYELIIRPHPRQVDITEFNLAADLANSFNYSIEFNVPLNEHLELCDYLITSFSTVGTEYIPYKKPLLVLDYYDQDLMGWLKWGVGIRIKNKNALHNTLNQKVIYINKEKHTNYTDFHFHKYNCLEEAIQNVQESINELN